MGQVLAGIRDLPSNSFFISRTPLAGEGEGMIKTDYCVVGASTFLVYMIVLSLQIGWAILFPFYR